MLKVSLVYRVALILFFALQNIWAGSSNQDTLKSELDKVEYYKRFGVTKVNYDEAKVPSYILPELLTCLDGSEVSTARIWQKKRRPEIKKLFEDYVYGKAPDKPTTMAFEVTSVDESALGGLATRKQISVHFFDKEAGASMDILLYLPNQRKQAVPIFFALNFGGNQCVHNDKGINLCRSWLSPRFGGVNNRATERTRGSMKSSWAIEKVLKNGYGLATIYCGDIDSEKINSSGAIRAHYYKKRQRKPQKNDWGRIATWAWGLSRGLDYFETDKDVDAKKVIVMGHSRLGKAALWAGAADERFALVISNNSGCGGAALSRRAVGETVGKITHTFPHWFCENFQNYHLKEAELPVDQHMLIALVAPRPVYVASAQLDRWADPRGEFLSAKKAQEVYQLFNYSKNVLTELPRVNEPVMGRVGYHIRTGKHNVMDFDWDAYLKFADIHLNKIIGK